MLMASAPNDKEREGGAEARPYKREHPILRIFFQFALQEQRPSFVRTSGREGWATHGHRQEPEPHAMARFEAISGKAASDSGFARHSRQAPIRDADRPSATLTTSGREMRGSRQLVLDRMKGNDRLLRL